MANYTTMFSCLLPVGAVNVGAALGLYKQMAAEWEEAGEEVGFEAGRDSASGEQLWIYSDDGDGDVEQVISYALKCAQAFDLRGTWVTVRRRHADSAACLWCT